MYGLSAFFIGEQKVAEELGPIMRAAPDRGPENLPLHADRRRGPPRALLRALLPRGRRARVRRARARCSSETSEHLNENFGRLFDEMLKQRTDRLSVEPEDTEALVEAVTIYHMVIEGMLALTGQHFIMDYNESEGTLPAFVEGFQNVARDEHRHVAFGSVFLREKARRGRALQAGDPAHARGGPAGRRRGPDAALGADRRRRLGAVRLLARRHPAVRRHQPDAAPQSNRPLLGEAGLLSCPPGYGSAGRRRGFAGASAGGSLGGGGAASSAGGALSAGGAAVRVRRR